MNYFNDIKQTFSDAQLAETYSKLQLSISSNHNPQSATRSPVHVVYGGANLFNANMTQKLGRIALKSLENYAPYFVEFANAMRL